MIFITNTFYIYNNETFEQSDVKLNNYRVKNDFFIEDTTKLKFYNLLCLDLFFSMIIKLDASITLEKRKTNILDILTDGVKRDNIKGLITEITGADVDGYEFGKSFIKKSGCTSFAGYYYLLSDTLPEDDKARYHTDHNDNKFQVDTENFNDEFTSVFNTKLEDLSVLFNKSKDGNNITSAQKYEYGYLINLLSKEELTEIYELLYKIIDLPPV